MKLNMKQKNHTIFERQVWTHSPQFTLQAPGSCSFAKYVCFIAWLSASACVCELTLTVLVTTIDAQWEGMGM